MRVVAIYLCTFRVHLEACYIFNEYLDATNKCIETEQSRSVLCVCATLSANVLLDVCTIYRTHVVGCHSGTNSRTKPLHMYARTPYTFWAARALHIAFIKMQIKVHTKATHGAAHASIAYANTRACARPSHHQGVSSHFFSVCHASIRTRARSPRSRMTGRVHTAETGVEQRQQPPPTPSPPHERMPIHCRA